ncbi:FAD-dependent monooxygenase [Umezawaea tangerina]|uniref:2-polyprenyl-6-methoxyphenol hydroxylase-like FAD-dependent oxidoreductase n=1 Tax=Umezawaea tangerina TaxID=84725 RepID=A0A2T0T6U1_9PSEU|nr:FAD-dependent monooxygenase [Umezawaea tangerina]PRY41385.1 2-polyprenyl-6-methoxyphenol hydroxylase-like FAD-dependent oxidoreductase [Umezawaea tangerina]
MDMDVDVTVVGAGPTGLVAAGELARRGRRVVVLDSAPAPFPGPRGNGIQPRTLEVLDPLGVTDRLVALGTFGLPFRQYGTDGTIRERDRHPELTPTPDRPFAQPMIIPQWRTTQVLRERLAEFGGAVEQNARVVGVEQDEDGVTAVLDDGRRVRSRYLVGADGGSSTVRRVLGVGFAGETHDEVRMVLAEVELDGLDRDHWHQFDLLGAGGPGFLSLCPMPACPTWALGLRSPDPDVRADEATLRAVVDDIRPRVRLRTIGWCSTWRLNVRMVDRFRVDRVFLAGDAAHVHSPAGGQGLNTGVQDAVNLGWKLAAVLDGAEETLLDTYEAERKPVAEAVIGFSGELTRRVLDSGAGGYADRPAALARQGLQLDLSYRTDPDAPGLRPGDRAPDAPLGDTTLFLLRRRADWTVLAFDGAADPVEGAQVLDADALDVDGHLRRTYEPVPGERVLIRPDGHLGWRGTGAVPVIGTTSALGYAG